MERPEGNIFVSSLLLKYTYNTHTHTHIYVLILLKYIHVYNNNGYRGDHELHEGWSRRWEELEGGKGAVEMM